MRSVSVLLGKCSIDVSMNRTYGGDYCASVKIWHMHYLYHYRRKYNPLPSALHLKPKEYVCM